MKNRLENIKARIAEAAVNCGRDPEEITLVAVSKTMSVEKIKTAIDAGADVFGENYIQEAREKFNTLSGYPVSWHFIGHLQSNKAKYAVRLFDLIHSVDSLKLARELDKRARHIGKIQNILIQVNISEEETKWGARKEDVLELITDISRLESLSIQGMMTMPPYFNAPEKVRPFFKALADTRDQLVSKVPANVRLKELSMGMTGDFETAIEEGATIVRIGTAIFGERN
jgi:pyridoxal phosphate enzyme (YggS family)